MRHAVLPAPGSKGEQECRNITGDFLDHRAFVFFGKCRRMSKTDDGIGWQHRPCQDRGGLEADKKDRLQFKAYLAHLSLHHTGLAEPVHHQFEIGRVLVGQDFATVFQRIVGIDAKHLLPCRAGLGETAQMAVAGG